MSRVLIHPPAVLPLPRGPRRQVCALCGHFYVEAGALPENEPAELRLCPVCIRLPPPPDEP